MSENRIHVTFPTDLLREIDAICGVRRRSAFIEDVLLREVRRRKLMKFLENKQPAWKDEDHPELARMGTAAWVRKMRRESERPSLRKPPRKSSNGSGNVVRKRTA